MNILFLADIVPYPPNTGIKIRTFNIIRQLAKENNIFLLCFNHKILINDPRLLENYTDRLLTYCSQVEVFDIDSDKNQVTYLACLAKNLFELSPYRAKRYLSRKCIDKINQIKKANRIDLVHLDKTEFYIYSKYMDGIPIVATNHNVESNLMLQRSRYEISFVRKQFALLQYLKTRRYEKKVLNKVTAYITCTEIDNKFFSEKLGINNLHAIIDNGVDVSYYLPQESGGSKYFLIIGAQSKESTANYDATMFFMEKIWPIIYGYDKTISLKIVGRNPDRSILKLGEQYHNIEVCGFVEDEREIFENATALLVPLRIGGGSRLKIITAMAMGKAIVSTTKGAEGIRCKHNVDIICQDQPAKFAAAVIALSHDQKTRKKLGNNARELAVKEYSWDSIGARLNNFYNLVLKQWKTRSH